MRVNEPGQLWVNNDPWVVVVWLFRLPATGVLVCLPPTDGVAMCCAR
jgi:hypothetical protein